MKSKWKMLAWPFTGLFAVLMFFLRGRSSDQEKVQKAQDEATAAEINAVNAKADLEKEKIKHETEQALDDAAALSDDDIIADALDEYRAGGSGGDSGGVGAEGSEFDG